MKNIIKYVGRSIKTAIGLWYDFGRLVKFGGMSEDLNDPATRNFASAKIYHALEKSLAFKERRVSSGWSQAKTLIFHNQAAKKAGNFGFHDIASIQVLGEFLSAPKMLEQPEAALIECQLERLRDNDLVKKGGDSKHGARLLQKQQLKKAVLEEPEDFFLTRSSIRTFLPHRVNAELFERAVNMANKSPTACNRQPWVVYNTDDPEIRDLALKHQSGNRGFGHEIPSLAIITVDHRAYMSGEERNAYLVDGAMFATTLIYAMHALGLGSCCLNWSRMPKDDRALRKALNIQPHHGIIMMIGFGYPDPTGNVCVSARKPVADIMQKLEKR